MAGCTLRVLVADDNESVRRSICQILRAQANIEVVCEAVDGADAVRKIREHEPDVVLLDITMPTMNGLEVAEIIKTEFLSVQVLIVSQHDSRGFQWAALAAGVSGYVNKSNVGRDLIPELRRIQCLRTCIKETGTELERETPQDTEPRRKTRASAR
jgi:DNA-binding NarL/FixJ family response regulator